MEPDRDGDNRRGRPGEVGLAFLRLGWTSFGGPSAHFAYFRDEFVDRRRWLDERVYAELLALTQLLPGPASSQLGMAIGLRRAGLAGGLLAWLGFTLPSAALMLALALVVQDIGEISTAGWLRGLKAVVVGVVAHAVLSMARRLCPDWPRRAIALLGAVVALGVAGPGGQVGAIALGGLLGWLGLRASVAATGADPGLAPIGRPAAAVCLGVAVGLLGLLPILAAATPAGPVALIDSFYRAGALVFGGGHVVLPLLQAEIVHPGWLSQELFLAGYGAAQAMPGPLFSFAAYVGALAPAGWPPALGAALCLVTLYLPSTLILLGVLPFWERLRRLPGMGGVLAGVGAAVVGLLAAVLIDPVVPTAIRAPGDALLALAAFGLLLWGRFPAWAIVIGCAAGGAMLAGG
jgi:chromate transporter